MGKGVENVLGACRSREEMRETVERVTLQNRNSHHHKKPNTVACHKKEVGKPNQSNLKDET